MTTNHDRAEQIGGSRGIQTGVELGRPVRPKLGRGVELIDSEKVFAVSQSKFPKAEAWQLSAKGTKDYVTSEGIRIAPATTLLRELT